MPQLLGSSGAPLSNDNPQPDGAADPGVASTASRSDHVHADASSAVTLTGNVTGTGSGTIATTIANDAVTYAKMQNVSATDKLLGRASSGAGDVEEITCTSFARTVLDDADAATMRATIGAGGASPTSVRGQLIRRGASADEAFSAKDANTFVGGDGTDVVSRTAAQAREAMGVPVGTFAAPTFSTGQGWTLVDAATAAYGEPTLEAGNLGRVTISNAANMYNLTGPRIERPITYQGPAWWRIRATPSAVAVTTTNVIGGIYVRGAGSSDFETVFCTSNGQVQAGGWSPPGSGLVGPVSGMTVGGGGKLQIIALGTTLHLGFLTNAGVWTSVTTRTFAWIPTHVGIFGAGDAGWAGRMDFSDFEVTSLG